MLDKYYTPEQLQQLEKLKEQHTEAEHLQYHRDWAELIEAAKVEKEKGTDPADPRMQEIATRWRELIDLFTGGDEGLLESLKTMFQEEGPERASQGSLDAELMEYVGRAVALQL